MVRRCPALFAPRCRASVRVAPPPYTLVIARLSPRVRRRDGARVRGYLLEEAGWCSHGQVRIGRLPCRGETRPSACVLCISPPPRRAHPHPTTILPTLTTPLPSGQIMSERDFVKALATDTVEQSHIRDLMTPLSKMITVSLTTGEGPAHAPVPTRCALDGLTRTQTPSLVQTHAAHRRTPPSVRPQAWANAWSSCASTRSATSP